MLRNPRVTGLLPIILLALLCFVPNLPAEMDVTGKTFYTKANIWYENPEKIYSTNYHRGAILAVGTKVTMKGVSAKEITFSNENGLDFRIVYIKKHSPGITVQDHFKRYFSEKTPMAYGGPFRKFSKSEQESIRKGEISEGMSKDAVLMSYGYPPPIKTPNLKSDRWVFMENRFMTRAVLFRDNKVTSVRK